MDSRKLRDWAFDLPAVRASWIITLGVAIQLAVGVFDYATGWELDVGVLYLVPVALVAWVVGYRPGYALAVLGGILTLLAEIVGGKPYSHPAMPLWNAAMDTLTMGVIARILSALRDAWQHEHEAARSDPLTHVLNRKGLIEVLLGEMERSRRYHHPVSFAYLDCDEFKRVNDRFGHEAGDLLLKAIARALGGTVRHMDRVARLGGDEFGILLPETGASEALMLSERLLETVDLLPETRRYEASLSIGVVTFLRMPPSVDDVLREADLMMYAVKTTGKRGVRHIVIDPISEVA